MSPKDHERTVGVTATIANRVRELRTRRGWTAAELGEALTAEGVRWDRFAVSSLENGKRQNVTVVELLTLAYVLGAPPALLLIPSSDFALEASGSLSLQAPELLAWLSGEEGPTGEASADPATSRQRRESLEVVGLVREYRRSLERLSVPRNRTSKTLGELARTVNRLIENGIHPPGMGELLELAMAHGFEYPEVLAGDLGSDELGQEDQAPPSKEEE